MAKPNNRGNFGVANLQHLAAVAVMAVAAIGFMMLTGRLNWRFGATVIIGVFILFGATTIVAGIQSAAG